MALAIVDVLDAHGRIDPDALATAFAARYAADDRRGYGSGARAPAHAPVHRRTVANRLPALFDGTGSLAMAAMRVAPVGDISPETTIVCVSALPAVCVLAG